MRAFLRRVPERLYALDTRSVARFRIGLVLTLSIQYRNPLVANWRSGRSCCSRRRRSRRCAPRSWSRSATAAWVRHSENARRDGGARLKSVTVHYLNEVPVASGEPASIGRVELWREPCEPAAASGR